MTDDLRSRIYDAVLSVLGPANPGGDPHPDAEPITDEVMAVLDREFPPMLALDPPLELSPEQVAAWQAQWAEAVSGGATQRLMILPPNASDLWRRRTPAERRAYLEAHRDEAIERGIPEDLIDMMVRDAEAAGRGHARAKGGRDA